MAEISLSAYQDRLTSFLAEDRHDEVIAHARHILKAFPKNLRAYEQLGDALFAGGRGEEAAEVLRRMLGARPQDFQANWQLARVYQEMGQGGRALWHAERAFDQRPNHRETMDLIRRLTLEERGERIERVQLTAGALAQQHVRNNALTEALDVLNGALARDPSRIDLQLMRARALWLDGQRMAAAEAADEILGKLPYSIIANRIMTELWLSEQRPSDAQVYLARVEDLDPYLARQLATGEAPPQDLVKLEELDYDSIPRHEAAIVNPDWLDSLRDSEAEAESGGLGPLFGSDDENDDENENENEAGAPPTATEGLDDLLADDEIESLFNELIAEDGEDSAPATAGDDGSEVIASLEEGGFMAPPAAPADADDAPGAQAVNEGDLDDDLARMLAQMEADDSDDNSWVMDIQQGGVESSDDESRQYIEDFDRDWLVEPGPDEEAVGAPWLSAAMREMRTESEEGDEFDLFAGDERLQHLLNRTSDTEPIQVDDIQSWLDPDELNDELNLDEPAEEAVADLNELDDELLAAPPADAWLDEALDEEINEEADVEEPQPVEAISDEEQNRLNANLIDSWQSELEDDDDEDPYVDWLSEDTAAGIDEELGVFSLDEAEAAAAPPDEPGAAPDVNLDLEESGVAEAARAWGLEDQDQLADFVEDELRPAAAEAAPGWLNATVPGLDRERDAEPDKESEFAGPLPRPGKEFAWVSDIVDEETGEMEAIQAPAPGPSATVFRFIKPPAWLRAMRGEAPPDASGDLGPVEAVAALSVVEDIDELELDDLTFDDYFNFDTPTDKMDAINLDDNGEGIDFSELGWDDYFDFNSPTEKTIAITLDEVKFQELGVEDEDFDFDTPIDKMPAITVKEELDPLEFEDIGLDDDAGLLVDRESSRGADAEWLDYDDAGAKDPAADDRDKSGGDTQL
ncbi:MAG: tetratricopeptide repeat protein [Chloroflexota bacterium]|nr:tetratricopeptide repeat protein [Chloroflexota bacterium]